MTENIDVTALQRVESLLCRKLGDNGSFPRSVQEIPDLLVLDCTYVLFPDARGKEFWEAVVPTAEVLACLVDLHGRKLKER